MKITIEIETGNAAFAGPSYHTPFTVGVEAGRILQELGRKIERSGVPGHDELPLMDMNGNRVGQLRSSEWDHSAAEASEDESDD